MWGRQTKDAKKLAFSDNVVALDLVSDLERGQLSGNACLVGFDKGDIWPSVTWYAKRAFLRL